MRWVVLLMFAADVLATSFIPAGFGTLSHRRLKRANGRRVDGTCKPRPTAFPSSTSAVLLPTSSPATVLLPTSAAPAPATTTRPSTPTPSSVPAGALITKLMPLGLGIVANSWTTVPNSNTDTYPLADTTLRPTRILGGSLQAASAAPDGKQALEVFFGAGSYALTNSPVAGGISFYAYGPSDLTHATELTLGYSVYFENGFDFVHGGKLPGFYGGSTDDGAISCSGGRFASDCFSTRFMWRDGGDGELYTYLPRVPENDALCSNAPIPGTTECGTDYGTSLGRGSFTFKAGQWNSVVQRIRLNKVGEPDGELQVWFNGKSIWTLRGVVFRGVGMEASVVRGLMVQSFFGGHDGYWASSKDQKLWLADFSVAVLH